LTGKSKVGNRRALAVVAVLACLVAAAVALRVGGCERGQEEAAAPAKHVWGADLPLTRVVLLFFPESSSGRLKAEPRRLVAREGTAGLIKSALLELGKGPQDKGLLSPFGQELKVRGVYSSADGTIFVDLAPGGEGTFGSGLSEEIAAVRAVASTVFFNFPQAGRLKILVDGEPAVSLAGHVDLSGFLYPEDWLDTSGLEL
jgi:hypothetical protein